MGLGGAARKRLGSDAAHRRGIHTDRARITVDEAAQPPAEVHTVSNQKLRTIARQIHESDRVLLHTGADLLASTSLPSRTLREAVWGSPDGQFSAERFESRPEGVWADWLDFWSSGTVDPETVDPQPVHDRVAELVAADHITAVVSETVFGLLQSAGVPTDRCIEFHGRADRARCRRCGRTEPANPAQSVGHRQCPSCLATLGPGIVLAEEPPAEHDRLRAWTEAEKCDLYLAVGTPLTVYPTAENAEHAVESGADLVVIGQHRTPLDDVATDRIEMDASGALARLRDAAAILQ